jgi:apolipoprotein N-acyltransferase
MLSLAWSDLPLGSIALFSFIPILIILEQLLKTDKKNESLLFFSYTFLSFLIWNTITIWWIAYATIPGAIAAIVLSSIFMAFTMYLSFVSFKILGRRIGYLVFVCNWIAFEYVLMHSQLSWPWLILGNAFSNSIGLIQWYEFVGVFGGTAWILTVNVLIYETYRQTIARQKNIKSYLIGLIVLILVPITYSVIRFYTYEEKHNPVNVLILQPNIDPYNEKFTTSAFTQMQTLTNTAKTYIKSEPDFFIAPETAIATGFYEDKSNQNIAILHIIDFLQDYPNSQFIIGATTRKRYENPSDFTKTSTISKDKSYAHDIFNSSLQISPDSTIQFYHKSKLVPGVETMPFPWVTEIFSDILVDLGGINGTHGTQDYRVAFKNSIDSIRPGVPVCYESVYGEFNNEFVKAGANVLFIITNDGWWKNTEGHKQHMRYAKLRAIETRRSIARSANTGISCIINQKGQVVQKIGWWERGAINGIINTNTYQTFYVKYGDFIARMGLVVAIIILVITILSKIKSRLEKNARAN